MPEPTVSTRLPENAYRELKPGEVYVPMVPPQATVPEVTARSILFGIAMNVLFSMAATYLALKVGQGIETAIPISILSVGLSGLLLKLGLRRSNIIENINILAISTTSGIVAGGTVFTMPAIYLLKLHEKLDLSNVQLFGLIFLVPFLGAVLGVVFLVPFRRYFVKEMHGKLPFPEATATNEILVTGAGEAGRNSWILIYSFLIAAGYRLCEGVFKLWPESFTTGRITFEYKEKVKLATDAATQAVETATEPIQRTVSTLAFPGNFGTDLTEKVKAVFSLGTGAEFAGLGYIIGLRYASIICAGSFLSWFVIIPMLAPFDLASLRLLNPQVKGISAELIFKGVCQNIGIGCIFAAGILSILKMGKVIVTALREALGSLLRGGGAASATHERTDSDISYSGLFAIGVVVTIALAVYFRFSVLAPLANSNWLTLVSVVLALLVSFVFITVSAWAIATISVTPISGMTVTTIIITAVVMMFAGLPKGDHAMLAVLLVGGVVASSLSMAGTLITEFKLGYWAGATPRRIQWSAIIAALLASLIVTATIIVLAKTPGYDREVSHAALAAPQANLMKSALESFLGESEVPWLLYAVGLVIALLLQLVGVSPLAFGLGIYLPMELNTPILVGAIVAALVKKSTSGEAASKARHDKGILIASGLIAGAAIMGVVINGFASWDAANDIMELLNVPARLIIGGSNQDTVCRVGNWLGLAAFLLLCAFAYFDSCRAKAAPADPGRPAPPAGHH